MITEAGAITTFRQWDCPLPAMQVQQILESASRLVPCRLVLSNGRGHIYNSVDHLDVARALPDDGLILDAKVRVPVMLNDSAVAMVEAVGPAQSRALLEQTAEAASTRLAEACTAFEEIDSLAGEIVRAYEELHLLYELGEGLTRPQSIAAAAHLILEKILTTLPAARAELQIFGPEAQIYAVNAQNTLPNGPDVDGAGHSLSTTMRSHGLDLGKIILMRPLEAGCFSSMDGKLLDGVATLAGNAILNSQLYDELRRQNETRLRAVMDNVAEGIITVDEAGNIESFNPAAEQIFGYSASEVVCQNFAMLIPASLQDEYGRDLSNFVRLGKSGVIGSTFHELVGKRKNGDSFPMDMSVTQVSVGAQPLYIASVRDITERKRWEETLQHQALHDALTGFPNRILLYDRIQQATLARQTVDKPLSLLILDLDHFKEVNDTFGHQYGDMLLRQIGPRLQEMLRSIDTIARLGGDEFAVLLPEADARDATKVTLRLLKALEQPFAVNGHLLGISASIGIALCPEHGQDADTLLRRADVAMYVAKRTRSEYAIYTSEQDHHSANQLALAAELRSAMEQKQFVLFYQPKGNMRDGKVSQVEALLRWRHPSLGLLMPGEFIPLAELTGLIRPLGDWVIDAALRQCRVWRDMGHDIGVSVNLSVQNIQDHRLPDLVAAAATAWEVPYDRLTLEITESSLMVDPDQTLGLLRRLFELGVRIAIDDFGTGYSSLAYLKRLPVNEIKIDKSFVSHMNVDKSDAAIVRSTIALGHDLGLIVTAEGIEDEATWDLLASLGCDVAQGYFLSHPLSASEFIRWRNRWQAKQAKLQMVKAD